MASVPEKLAAAVAALPFVQVPEGWEGGSPLNIPGLAAGLPLDDPWDTVAKASAPGLSGDEVRFAVTADGRTISGGDASRRRSSRSSARSRITSRRRSG
jgi:hypothetical protein